MGNADENISDRDLDLNLDESGVDLDRSSYGGTDNPVSAAPAGLPVPPQAAVSAFPSEVEGRGDVADLSGRNLDGLVIQRKLGEGGMGEVWLAHDEDLDIQVAVKVLPPHLAADQGFVMRFLREARAVAKLEHPNIVGVKQAGKREVTGQFLRVMVMEYVEGSDALVALHEAPGMKLEPQRAAEITLACAKALKYAHGKGVIHRDVKPANILISKDGENIKLLDFGLAKLQRRADVPVRPNDHEEGGQGRPPSEREEAPGSSTHNILGTPSYMPPEQCEGKPADGRADIYSLGITLYELLTGSVPFKGDTVFSIIEGHVRKPLEFPKDAFEDVPPLFTELIGGMCEKKPDDRWALKQVIEKLGEFLGVSRPASRTPTGLSVPPQASRTNLQKRNTSFVGRSNELKAISDLVNDENVKLVTIVGPGGVGKTRITQEYGLTQAATPDYPGGVWFCDLTEARSVDGICYAVSQGIGVPLTQADSLAQIEAILSMRENCLMIFDNFEQVVEHASETLGRWMAKAPKVKFITSSREPLHLEGERPFPLQPLSSSRERGSPDPQIGPEGRKDEDKNADVDIRAPDQEPPPAIQLFIDRASVAKRGFKVDEASLSAIAQIVDQLDGIPLAIELAASRCSALSPQKLLGRLPRRFDLLKGRRKDASARQATLRGAIDWSWNLLEDYEKSALAQCSVFQNGFFLEAAEAVIDLSGFDDAPFEMDVIETLVEKSLLVSYEVPSLPGETRYRMLESIRQYAGEKLEEAEVDSNALLLRHAEHYVEYAEEWDERIYSIDAVEALDRMELELENLIGIQEALELEHPVLAALAIQRCYKTLKIRGPWKERIPRFEVALSGLTRHASAEQENLSLRIQLSHSLTNTYADCGSKEDLEAAAEHCRLLASRIEGDDEDSMILKLSASQAQYTARQRAGRFKEAAEALDYSLSQLGFQTSGIAASSRDYSERLRRILAANIGNRGTLHESLGEYDLALACYTEAESMNRELGNQSFLAANVGNRGLVHINLGEYDRALACFAISESIERELGNQFGVAIHNGNRGIVHQRLGEFDQALACYAESEFIASELGSQSMVSSCVGNRGSVHLRLGEYELALACFSEGEACDRELGDQSGIAYNVVSRGLVLLRIDRLAEAWEALEEAESISREIAEKSIVTAALQAKALVLLNPSFVLYSEDTVKSNLERALGLAQECFAISTEMGIHKTEPYFHTLTTLAVIEKRLSEAGTSVEASEFGPAMTADELLAAAKDQAEQAKALGEELKLDRHEKHGPKKGEVTEYWQFVDEVLE